MNRSTPFLIKDVNKLRDRIRMIEANDGDTRRDAQLWQLLKNCARTAPERFPWFTPFVALMTGEKQDIAHAKKVLLDYVAKLEPQYFTSGLQYHFWCFAFPHAKWSMYFQWLCTMGAFSPDEEKHIRENLITYQFLNFFYGMRTKPEPECIDNQALSLCFSNVLVGHLFSSGEQPSVMAKLMLEEGGRRLPGIVGGMPASGYTGEGSTYMDCVVGPAIPLIVELMEAMTGDTDVFLRSFAPNGVIPENVLRMVAQEWMPGGLLLPWDNYGYQHGVRAPIAYAAWKTKKPAYKDILFRHAVWTYDVGVGWSFDDLVWTFIWWPDDETLPETPDYRWSHPEVGGAITAHDNEYYLMQMWDASEPVIPTRSHVNPNAVILNAYGIPLSLDGSITQNCTRFHFEDTWREVVHSVGEVTRYNYGDGCGGSHSVLLVDRWEGLRAMTSYEQHQALELDHLNGTVSADVTPIYRERFRDAVKVRRRSSAAADRFFVIEDQAVFREPHYFTSRFVLRPSFVDTNSGAKVQTQEGVTLHLIDVFGNTSVTCERIEGSIYAFPMDQETIMVDFNGFSGTRLFVAFMSRVYTPSVPEEDWQTVSDQSERMDYEEAWNQLNASQHVLPFKLPAYMEKPLPIVKRWWYYKKVKKETGASWLQLPRAMQNAKCWINHHEIDLSPFGSRLLAPVIPIPASLEDDLEIDVVIRCDVPTSHYDGDNGIIIGLNGGTAMCYPCEEEQIISASYDGEQIKVTTDTSQYCWPYRLMEE